MSGIDLLLRQEVSSERRRIRRAIAPALRDLRDWLAVYGASSSVLAHVAAIDRATKPAARKAAKGKR